MLEGPEQDLHLKDLDTLFDLMERDLNRHFHFEDRIIFEAVLSGEENRSMAETVKGLQQEHVVIMEQLNSLVSELKKLINEHQNTGMIGKIMRGLKARLLKRELTLCGKKSIRLWKW
jgi:iron-sulfur cluster repair protein YtfE (RIC family)